MKILMAVADINRAIKHLINGINIRFRGHINEGVVGAAFSDGLLHTGAAEPIKKWVRKLP